MRRRWVMLMVASVVAVASACGGGPTTGVDEEPELLTETEPIAPGPQP